MSANFCDENPDQTVSNAHCFHKVSSREMPSKKGQPRGWKTLVVTSQCCWCGDKTVEYVPAPLAHGTKAKVMR